MKALVAQGGGPTTVINQSLAGVVLKARRYESIVSMYGAQNGVRGIVNENFVDLDHVTEDELQRVAATPGAALGSTRDKPDVSYCRDVLRVLKAHEIDLLFYIGGNDSADTLRIVNEEAWRIGYQLRCVHVPKTIDNDLVGSDHTPGYPSAARFVAQTFAGANLDNASLPGVYIAIVMGRNAGFLTAASALARTTDDDGPHLIYLPERPFALDPFLASVRKVHDRHGRCVVAVSEGIRDASDKPILAGLMNSLDIDAHGNPQLAGTGILADLLCEEVKSKLKIKRTRSDTLGYLQRSFPSCISDVDRREAREVGEKAVEFAMELKRDGSVALIRTGDYTVGYDYLALEVVAGKTRRMDAVFIAENGTDVTGEFRKYLQPLLGADMPTLHRLRAGIVSKKGVARIRAVR